MMAYAGLTLMTLIIGFSFVFVKMALRHASAVDLLAHRFSAATLALLLYYLLTGKKWPSFRRSEFASLFLLSLFYPILIFSMQTIGLRFTTASEAGILSATAPIFTVVFAAIFLKEKTSLRQLLFVLLSVGGVMYIMYRDGLGEITGTTLKGDFFILLSVISMSVYFVLGRKLSRRVPPMDITFFMIVTAFVVFNLISLSSHLKEGTLSGYCEAFSNRDFLLSVLYLGILSSFLTSFLTTSALTVIPASQVSIFNNLSPVIAVFSGVWFLDETLRSYHWIGGLFVLIGIVGVNLLESKNRPTAKKESGR